MRLPPKRPRSWEVKRPPQSGRNFHNPMYHTTAWRRLRAAHLADNPLCVECRKIGELRQAQVVDHIKPVSTGVDEFERESLMWNPDNLQSLCNQHHNQKSGYERNGKGI